MIQWATEIKVRAERKAGEMLTLSAATGERANKEGNINQYTRVSNDATPTPTLAEIGVTRDQSSRWQQLAALPEEHFETAVATVKVARSPRRMLAFSALGRSECRQNMSNHFRRAAAVKQEFDCSTA